MTDPKCNRTDAAQFADVHSWSHDGSSLALWLILRDDSLVAVDLDIAELLAEAYPIDGGSTD
jgi:hypothetical protein